MNAVTFYKTSLLNKIIHVVLSNSSSNVNERRLHRSAIRVLLSSLLWFDVDINPGKRTTDGSMQAYIFIPFIIISL